MMRKVKPLTAGSVLPVRVLCVLMWWGNVPGLVALHGTPRRRPL